MAGRLNLGFSEKVILGFQFCLVFLAFCVYKFLVLIYEDRTQHYDPKIHE